MTKTFEIFTEKSALDAKLDAINILLGYRNIETKTDCYDCGMQKYEGTDWCMCIDAHLVAACADMTDEERAVYYDDSDLKTYQWLVDNDWFEPYEA